MVDEPRIAAGFVTASCQSGQLVWLHIHGNAHTLSFNLLINIHKSRPHARVDLDTFASGGEIGMHTHQS